MFFDLEPCDESCSIGCSVLALDIFPYVNNVDSFYPFQSCNDYGSIVVSTVSTQAVQRSFIIMRGLDYLDLQQGEYTSGRRLVNTQESLRRQINRRIASLKIFQPSSFHEEILVSSEKTDNLTDLGVFSHERMLVPGHRSGKLSVTFGKDIIRYVQKCTCRVEKIAALLPKIENVITDDLNDIGKYFLHVLFVDHCTDSVLVVNVLHHLTPGCLWTLGYDSRLPKKLMRQMLDFCFHHIYQSAVGHQDLAIHLKGLLLQPHYFIIMQCEVFQVLLKYGISCRIPNCFWWTQAIQSLKEMRSVGGPEWLVENKFEDMEFHRADLCPKRATRYSLVSMMLAFFIQRRHEDSFEFNENRSQNEVLDIGPLREEAYPDVLLMFWRSIPDAYLTSEDFIEMFYVDRLQDFDVRELYGMYKWYRRMVVPVEEPNHRTPRSLLHYSRCKVRQMLTRTLKLPRGIEELRVPEILKSYLRLEC